MTLQEGHFFIKLNEYFLKRKSTSLFVAQSLVQVCPSPTARPPPIPTSLHRTVAFCSVISLICVQGKLEKREIL